MSQEKQIHLLILWDHEIRQAARALKAVRAAFDDESSSEADRVQLINVAFNACEAALHGADNDGAALMLSSIPPLGLDVQTTRARRKGSP